MAFSTHARHVVVVDSLGPALASRCILTFVGAAQQLHARDGADTSSHLPNILHLSRC